MDTWIPEYLPDQYSLVLEISVIFAHLEIWENQNKNWMILLILAILSASCLNLSNSTYLGQWSFSPIRCLPNFYEFLSKYNQRRTNFNFIYLFLWWELLLLLNAMLMVEWMVLANNDLINIHSIRYIEFTSYRWHIVLLLCHWCHWYCWRGVCHVSIVSLSLPTQFTRMMYLLISSPCILCDARGSNFI